MRLLFCTCFLLLFACSSEDQIQESGYLGPHYQHYKEHHGHPARTESEWDKIADIFERKKIDSGHRRHADYKTFGWHMYTTGTAYTQYDFSLLWGIGYFSYILDPNTGKAQNDFNWDSTALIDSAQLHGCKVFLTVSNFGSKANRQFLKNQKAQETLIDSLSALLQRRQGDGVNIDFELVPADSREQFSSFLINLSKKLKAANPEYTVTLALYNVDWDHVFQIETIDPHIDYYILMGYDYHGAFSKKAGPVAPLNNSDTWGNYSLDASVDYYLNEGIRNQKFIVALPFYGAKWLTRGMRLPSRVRHFINHPRIADISETYIQPAEQTIYYDTASTSRYLNLRDQRGREVQLWFDDSTTLARKFDWIKQRKLAGAGFWALSYSTADPELWELVGKKFGKRE